MELNKEDRGKRKYICVQLPELTDEKNEAYKAGYKTIAEISKERIRRAGKKIQGEINTEIKKIEAEISKLHGELPTEETKTEIENLDSGQRLPLIPAYAATFKRGVICEAGAAASRKDSEVNTAKN